MRPQIVKKTQNNSTEYILIDQYSFSAALIRNCSLHSGNPYCPCEPNCLFEHSEPYRPGLNHNDNV